MIFMFGLDQGFVMQTGVAIRSLDRFLSEQDRVVVLHLGISNDSQRMLRVCAQNSRVEFHDCKDMIHSSWIPPKWLSEAAFLRYLAPALLSGDHRCVYLDGDVIVRRSPRELHDADLGDATLGAVRSRVAPFVASPGGIKKWFDLAIPSTAPYFNSGVLVIDLDRWRDRRVTERLTEFLEAHGAETWIADQEALNVAVVGDWKDMERSWNYITHVSESFLQQPEVEPNDPHIVHFAGRQKPWSWGPKPLYADEWYHQLKDSPWSGYRPVPAVRPRGLKAYTGRALGSLIRKLRSIAQ